MTTTNDKTIIAFLLALQDLTTSLSPQEKQNLQEVAKQLNTQPKAWETHIKENLLEIISANNELNQFYQFYQAQLENIAEIPKSLLPTEGEVNSLIFPEIFVIDRGFKPKSEAVGYENQINNVVVIIGNSETPEETLKKAKFLEKLKQFVSQSHPSN